MSEVTGMVLSDKPRVRPGVLYECVLSPDQKDRPEKMYFLCTNIVLDQDNAKPIYYGYTNRPNTSYENHINEFVIHNNVLNHIGCNIDGDITIYYSNASNDVDTHAWLTINDAGVVEYHDGDYTRVVELIYLGTLSQDNIHDWYMVKNACNYWKLHQHKDIPIKIGDVFRYADSEDHDDYWLIPMRQCQYDLSKMGYFCMKRRPDGITYSYKIATDDLKQDIADGKAKYIGYINPFYFRQYFDIYQGNGNPYIANIYTILNK